MSNRIMLRGVILLALLLASAGTALPRENSTELYRTGARLALGGQLDKAIPIFKQVVEISPYYCLGHYGLGKAYLYKRGMLDEAIKQLRLSVQLDRKLVKGYFYLGIAYLLAKKCGAAARAFKTAYSFDDTYIEALYNIGVVFDIMDKSYDSGVYFNKYINEKMKVEEDIIF